MPLEEFIELYAKISGERKSAAREHVAIFFRTLSSVFRDMDVGDTFSVYGFGVFSKKERASHTVRNIQTKELIEIPKKSLIHFTPSKHPIYAFRSYKDIDTSDVEE